MPVPTYDKFIEPVLRYLAAHPEGAVARNVNEAAASALDISDLDRQVLLPSGVQPVYKNRAGWAHDRLKRAGLSSSPRRGYWQLTERGIAFASSHPTPPSDEPLDQLAVGFMDIRLRPYADNERPPVARRLLQVPRHHQPSLAQMIALAKLSTSSVVPSLPSSWTLLVPYHHHSLK